MNHQLRIRGILSEVAPDSEGQLRLMRQDSFCRDTKINDSRDPAGGFGGLALRSNSEDEPGSEGTESGGTRDRIQIRGRILAPDAMGSHSSGEQLGGATLGVKPRGWERVRSGGGGPPGLTFRRFSGPLRAQVRTMP